MTEATQQTSERGTISLRGRDGEITHILLADNFRDGACHLRHVVRVKDQRNNPGLKPYHDESIAAWETKGELPFHLNFSLL